METTTKDPESQQTESPKKSESEEIVLMRSVLHRHGKQTHGLNEDAVRKIYNSHQSEVAVRRDRGASRLESLAATGLINAKRAALRRNHVDPDGMSDDEIDSNYEKIKASEDANREQKASEERDRQRRIRAGQLFASAAFPRRAAMNLTAINLRAHPRWKTEHDKVTARLNDPAGFLFVFLGISGTGKTDMAVSVGNVACENLMSCLYIKALDVFAMIRRAYVPKAKGAAGESEDQLRATLRAPDLLVIDECHERSESEFENRMLINLIDHRYDDMKRTIIIANQTDSQFANSIGPSVISRLHEIGDRIEFNWQSFREKR